MQTIGMVDSLTGAIGGRGGADICHEIALYGERALRLRLGRFQLELRLRRETTASERAGVSPEFTDVELVRLARHSDASYGATWEHGLAMQYGALGNLPR